jgi:putative FmdB family regulatory protein
MSTTEEESALDINLEREWYQLSMPIYDFQCKTCGEIEENVHVSNIETDGIHVCPKCGAEQKRLLGAPSRILFRSKGGYLSTVPD